MFEAGVGKFPVCSLANREIGGVPETGSLMTAPSANKLENTLSSRTLEKAARFSPTDKPTPLRDDRPCRPGRPPVQLLDAGASVDDLRPLMQPLMRKL